MWSIEKQDTHMPVMSAEEKKNALSQTKWIKCLKIESLCIVIILN